MRFTQQGVEFRKSYGMTLLRKYPPRCERCHGIGQGNVNHGALETDDVKHHHEMGSQGHGGHLNPSVLPMYPQADYRNGAEKGQDKPHGGVGETG